LLVSSSCVASKSIPNSGIASVTQLYAFFYTPNPPFQTSNGWTLYSPRDEYGRMGVGTRSKAWRFTDINKDYSVSTLSMHHLATFSELYI